MKRNLYTLKISKNMAEPCLKTWQYQIVIFLIIQIVIVTSYVVCMCLLCHCMSLLYVDRELMGNIAHHLPPTHHTISWDCHLVARKINPVKTRAGELISLRPGVYSDAVGTDDVLREVSAFRS